jgi:hypothetical protein
MASGSGDKRLQPRRFRERIGVEERNGVELTSGTGGDVVRMSSASWRV